MSHDVSIHQAQTAILRELLFAREAGFAQMQKATGLSSDHFAFHVKRLVELGLVEKRSSQLYALTPRGKEHANKLDTDNNTVERQPKTAVLLAIRDEAGRYLFQERLKQPYFGYWGFPSGKVRWGESIIETAERELLEETGLRGTYEYRGLYHERTYGEEDGELLEDKIFFIVLCTSLEGTMIEEFEGGRNAWLSVEEVRAMERTFTSVETELAIAAGEATFSEEVHRYTREQF